MAVTLIGIDCATKDDKVGIARGNFGDGLCRVDEVLVCGKQSPLERTVTQWIPNEGRVLFALDAPLGWPAPMGRALLVHSAGQPIFESGNNLFRRYTDRFVKTEIGQQSLDVGADRIARTALAALMLLANLREATGEEIPIAWTPDFTQRVAAIEVYPAATLSARSISSKGYKAPDQSAARRNILLRVDAEIEVNARTDVLENQADALDAALCVLAAADFLRGHAFPPDDQPLAEKEGWIWVRRPSPMRPSETTA